MHRQWQSYADAPDEAGEITILYVCRWLVGDAYFEARRTPVDEPNGTVGFRLGNSGGGVVRNHVSTVQQCTCHCNGERLSNNLGVNTECIFLPWDRNGSPGCHIGSRHW